LFQNTTAEKSTYKYLRLPQKYCCRREVTGKNQFDTSPFFVL
jgi:hypothetical protein